MPLYDYKCPDCRARFEVRHGMTETPDVRCECGALASKAVGNPRVTFQGGKDFWHNNTLRSALDRSMAEARAGGIDAQPVGQRWV
jgi:putative FmdB family regulatory protein